MVDYYQIQKKLMSILSENPNSDDLIFVKDFFGLQYLKSSVELKKALK